MYIHVKYSTYLHVHTCKVLYMYIHVQYSTYLHVHTCTVQYTVYVKVYIILHVHTNYIIIKYPKYWLYNG